MQSKSVAQTLHCGLGTFALFVCLAMTAAVAQQTGPPTEMKPPGDPTAQTRPATTPATAPAPAAKPTAPEPAPVTDSIESAKPATVTSDTKPESDRNAIPTTTIY